MKVSTVAEMRALDRAAIEQFGIPEEILMENAGLSVFAVIKDRFDLREQHFLVISGGGNNGADGLVVARKIHSAGGAVSVILLGDAEQYRGAARVNYQAAVRLGLPMRCVQRVDEAKDWIEKCDVIVDALFGTGLARPLDGVHREIVQSVNASRKPVVSVDIPSGINGDTGQVMGAAIRAEMTVTFGLPKIGNLLYPGYAHCGRLFVSHISFPPQIYAALAMQTNTPPPLPPRTPDGHKGTFGDALFIAGAAGYCGAPYFSAFSFLKAGGGYARLAAPASIIPTIASHAAEIVFLPQPETAGGALSLAALPGIRAAAEKVDFVVLGPGISLEEETQQLARELIKTLEKPLLIDGDGLSALSTAPHLLHERKASTLLTPHEGEMARLTGLSVAQIRSDRVAALRSACTSLHAHIVLKGAHSLIGCPDGRIFVNLSGNAGMASAGSGDVLTGAIAAAAGLGLGFEDAMCKGVYLHGLAGDLAAAEFGQDGMTASDILNHLPAALLHDRNQAVHDLSAAVGTQEFPIAL